MFARIVHSDWSKHPGGRWCASARRTPTGWRAAGPWPVGDMGAFVERLVALGRSGPTLAAFDFPIGLPKALAEKPAFADLPGFRAALAAFGGPGWKMWFTPAGVPAEIGPRRPFYPARPGASAVRHLLDGLGVAAIGDLTRCAERGGPGVRAAGCMFWLVGAKTVGKAAIHGWQSVIRLALERDATLWPFDGELATLAARGGLVLAESYPGDATRQLGLVVKSKSEPAVLAALAPAVLRWVDDRQIELATDLRDAIASGFSAFAPHVGDAFDAAIGLLAAIAVADGAPDGALDTKAVRTWEGWILGRQSPAGIPAAVGAFKAGGET